MQTFYQDAVILPNKNTSEDCLLLNIYVPNDSSHKKSVMVWVHGGSYNDGQGMAYDGSYLAVRGDVIVVTINYRLGAFGFFSTNDDIAPGNYGLWDQRLAIQWVFDNIDSFGGDPKSITVFGKSSGGFSVGLLPLSPINAGLFNRIILQSGVGNAHVAISPVVRSASKRLAKALNCPISLTNDTMKCIRRKGTAEIFKAYKIASYEQGQTLEIPFPIPFAPVVDGKFLLDSPHNIISRRKGVSFEFFKSLDVLIGNCEGEGSILLSILADKHYNVSAGISTDYSCNHIIPTFTDVFYDNKTRITTAICSKYKTDVSIGQQSIHSVNFFGDAFLYSPALQSLNSHAVKNSTGKTFQYMVRKLSLDRKNLFSFIPWFKAAGHGYENQYLFPFKGMSNYSEDAKSFSETVTKYWSNFAKYGDVNGPGLPHWPQYDVGRKQFAFLGDNVNIGNNLYKDRMDFWLNKIPQLFKLDTTHSGFG